MTFLPQFGASETVDRGRNISYKRRHVETRVRRVSSARLAAGRPSVFFLALIPAVPLAFFFQVRRQCEADVFAFLVDGGQDRQV